MATIDWGDGSEPLAGTLRELPANTWEMDRISAHTYASARTRTVTITGNITGISLGHKKAVTAIDVSQMPGLEALICNGEKLSALNVTGNPTLKWLDCSDNDLYGTYIAGIFNTLPHRTSVQSAWVNVSGNPGLDYKGYLEARAALIAKGWSVAD